MPESRRNPPWSRDELILALDLYMQFRGHFPSDAMADPRIPELSQLLRKMHASDDGGLPDNLRSPSSVYMKLMNLRRLDPDDSAAGLDAGAKAEEEVWAVFANDPETLRMTAAAIREAIEAGLRPGPSEAEDELEVEAVEGRILTRLHRERERNRQIVERKKRAVLRERGRLECEACGFDFAEAYGSRGEGFIECHHVRPVSELRRHTRTRLSDLALLCANCHRMIHWRRPWLSVGQLRELLRKHRKNSTQRVP